MLKHHRFHGVRLWATVAIVLTRGVPAVADVTIDFTGEVLSVSHDDVGIFPGISPGAPVTGSFSYDPSTPAIGPGPPDIAFYSTGSISIQIGALSFTGDGSFRETIIANDHVASDGALIDAVRINNSFGCGDASQMAISLSDEDATIFNNVALPAVFPDLVEFGSATDGAQVYCADGADESFLFINILSMSQRPGDDWPPTVPTVSTWGMIVLALLLAVGLTIQFRVASRQYKTT